MNHPQTGELTPEDIKSIFFSSVCKMKKQTTDYALSVTPFNGKKNHQKIKNDIKQTAQELIDLCEMME